MSGINVTISSTSPGVSIGGGTSVSVAVSGPSSPVSVSLLAGGSTSLPDITQLEAGTGITISTAANQFTISSYSTSQVASYSAVKSVNGKVGVVSLQAVDVTAAAVSHTHSTSDVVGITALIGSSSPVQSVAGRTGAITLTQADVSGLAAIASSGSASDLASGTVPVARLPIATSTAAGAVQVGSGLSISSGVLSATGGGGSSITLSDSTPQALGTASAGTSADASRADHVHALPVATTAAFGTIKVGSGLSVASGVLSASAGGGASFVTVPASKTATGTSGQFAADSSWLYACYSSNSWLRVARDAWITVPGAPTITSSSGTFGSAVVSGNLTGGTVDVAWTAPQDTGGEITGYVVQLDNTTPVSVGPQVTNYQFSGLTTNASTCRGFTVTVRAVNSAGQGSAATASGVMPNTIVPSLWSISKTPNEGAPGVEYAIAWMPPCATAGWTSYQIQVREYFNGSEVVVTGDEDGWSTWATVTGTTGHSAQVSATSNQQYSFRVRALTVVNVSTTAQSGWSNVLTL